MVGVPRDRRFIFALSIIFLSLVSGDGGKRMGVVGEVK